MVWPWMTIDDPHIGFSSHGRARVRTTSWSMASLPSCGGLDQHCFSAFKYWEKRPWMVCQWGVPSKWPFQCEKLMMTSPGMGQRNPAHHLGWLKPLKSWDAYHLSTGAGFRNHPPYDGHSIGPWSPGRALGPFFWKPWPGDVVNLTIIRCVQCVFFHIYIYVCVQYVQYVQQNITPIIICIYIYLFVYLVCIYFT